MKKIIASILAVFFVLLSPLSAWASTSDSFLQLVPVRVSNTVIEYNPSDSENNFDSNISLMSITPEEILDGGLSVETSLYTVTNNVQSSSLRSLLITAFNPPLTQSTSNSFSGGAYNSWNGSKDYYNLVTTFKNTNGTNIVDANCSFEMSFSGLGSSAVRRFVHYSGTVENRTSAMVPSNVNSVFAIFYNQDKSSSVTVDITDSFLSTGNYVGFSHKFDAVDFEIYFIDIQYHISNTAYKSMGSLPNEYAAWENVISFNISFSDSTVSMDIEEYDESIGLLKGIIEWLRSIRDGITGVFDAITELPNKIQDMLMGLIVPDSDTMANKYSEFSGLLEEKLGVIYQIPMMLFDFFDTIVNAATTPQTTLTLPAFHLPWIDGSTLTVWQPMEYRIIPEGMQVLSDLIKTITSMTVVVLTFNSVKRAYERFLRS